MSLAECTLLLYFFHVMQQHVDSAYVLNESSASDFYNFHKKHL